MLGARQNGCQTESVGKILSDVLLLLIMGGVLLYTAWWFRQPRPGHVKDEALLAGRDASSFPAADEDYFHDMDGGSHQDCPKDNDDVKGRDTWLVWAGGNDRFWNTMIYKSLGALDFLKTLSSHPEFLKIDPHFSRDKRWEYLGLVNDPCFEKATGPDPERWGLWLDKRRPTVSPILLRMSRNILACGSEREDKTLARSSKWVLTMAMKRALWVCAFSRTRISMMRRPKSGTPNRYYTDTTYYER